MNTALITGTSSGIGFHLAIQLCRAGWKVFGISRDRSRFAKSLEGAGMTAAPEQFHPIIADIDRESELDRALRDSGLPAAPDLLVNNAGYGLYGAFEEIPEEALRQQFETNYFSSLRLIRRFLPEMRERGTGRILNVTSILGTMVIPGGSAYCSSKWALEAMTETLRYEVSPFGIQVCAVEPGLVRTGFKSSIRTHGRIGEPLSPYRFLNRQIESEVLKYGRFAAAPERAAREILRLIQRKRLPARYRVGTDAGLYHLLKTMLPDFALDGFFRNYTERQYRNHSRETTPRGVH